MEERTQKSVQVQSPGATGGKSTVRKKVSKKPKIQREPQATPPLQPQQQPTQGQVRRRQPIPSGGWKIAKRTGKIIAGGGTGAGILGWAVSSGSDATASTFSSTVAFIHTLF